ncbi:hypothetical protein SteCoe_22024 [Stentor coeruleus]|uniref:RING-type domain-containing protein n=1 Tax=Stentor coeruleus TaxID=5963 RepID=A0A1R2BN65_9CILI|nr:hypothetical protein SteCoe_22024 [Stentor coeruleus]
MNFCDTVCLICDDIGVRPINYSKYHKICQNHLTNIDDVILITCKHCNSNVLILRDFIFCSTCNNKECQVHPGYHNSLEIKPKINPEKEIEISIDPEKLNTHIVDISYEDSNEKPKCKKCHPSTEKIPCLACKEVFCPKCNPFEQYCSNCLNNLNDCDNCGKIGMLITLKCSHSGCYNCKDENFCKKCNTISTEKCDNCNKPYKMKLERNCRHKACDQCINGVCRKCISSKSIIKKNCINCGKECDSVLTMKCNHEGCHSCQNSPCKMCNRNTGEYKQNKCPTCGKPYIYIAEKGCSHKRCENCREKPCIACYNETLVYTCQYCNKKTDRVTKIQCLHELCGQCMNDNIYKTNNEILCLKCYSSSQEIREVEYTKPQTNSSNFNFFSCGYQVENRSCGAYSLKNSVKCCYCRKTASNIKEITCGHLMCQVCISEKQLCQICTFNKNECSYCFAISSDLLVLECQHSMCRMCINQRKTCKRCKRNKCHQCKREKASDTGDCGHDLCRKCFEINKKCYECDKKSVMYCPNCGDKTVENLIFKCKHHGCIICVDNHVCYKCAKKLNNKKLNKKNSEICSYCKISTNEFLYLRCKHVICISCLKDLDETKLKNLNYSCLQCISEGILFEQICSSCHCMTRWDIKNLIFTKSCCKKELCTKCYSLIADKNHSCNECISF